MCLDTLQVQHKRTKLILEEGGGGQSVVEHICFFLKKKKRLSSFNPVLQIAEYFIIDLFKLKQKLL